MIHVNGDSGKGHANGDFGKEQNGETYPSKQTNDTKTKKEVKKDMKKIGARELVSKLRLRIFGILLYIFYRILNWLIPKHNFYKDSFEEISNNSLQLANIFLF